MSRRYGGFVNPETRVLGQMRGFQACEDPFVYMSLAQQSAVTVVEKCMRGLGAITSMFLRWLVNTFRAVLLSLGFHSAIYNTMRPA
jgi:hypothetical protein